MFCADDMNMTMSVWTYMYARVVDMACADSSNTVFVCI